MNPLNWFRRINAELAAAREQWRRDRYRKALRRRRVILPSPRPEAVRDNWLGRNPEAR